MGKIFPDQAISVAVVHHGTIFAMNVESCRRGAALEPSQAAAGRRFTRQSRLTPSRHSPLHIAAPENVPEPSSIASPNLLSLPHRTRPEPELFFLFPFLDINHLLVWALWGCGRRDRVVQAQRQIHRALGKAGIIKPSRYPSCRWTDRPAPRRVAAHRLGRGRRVTFAARQRS